jgi:hypothetical protein
MLRSGALDLTRNPINVALSGTIGTWPGGWPSSRDLDVSRITSSWRLLMYQSFTKVFPPPWASPRGHWVEVPR